MYAPHVLPAARDYDALYRSFRWQVPAHYNIGVDVCDRWADVDPRRIAIVDLRADGGVDEISYRLEDSGARALITNAQGLAKLAGRRNAVPALVLSIDGAGDGAEG